MNQNTNDNLAILIFSKDRAMQLNATLESLIMYGPEAEETTTFVLFAASNEMYARQYDDVSKRFTFASFLPEENFKQQTIDVVSSCKHILFLVDDNIFVRDFKLSDVIKSLSSRHDAIGFSLRLGTNTTHCYMKKAEQALPDLTRVGDNTLIYDWRTAEYDFAYPLELSSSAYRSDDILPLLIQLDFSNPNILEGLMAVNKHLYSDARPKLLCYEKSVTFCNPINIVQKVCENRSSGEGRYSADTLAEMFNKDMRIDVDRYSGFTPVSCHQEMELMFKKKDCEAMNKDELVSVEMVTYNGAEFIGRAIESVLAQTYQNFELVIVDDGSTDGYIYQEHRNASSARNRAIQKSNGEYILCVDSDDFLDSDYLERILTYARKEPDIDFFYPGCLVLVDGDGNPTGQKWEYLDFSNNLTLPPFLFENGFSPIPNPGSLISRALFDRLGMYEDVDTVEDFVFLCRNALKINFKRVPGPSNYFYRRVNTGLSQKFETRNNITARVLREMVSMYNPQQLCPDLSQIKSPSLRNQTYYKYLIATFNKHAQTHADRFGHHFTFYGEFFKAELIRQLIRSDRINLTKQEPDVMYPSANVGAME
jgi:glycosyltransferase involved in cell wall biosynthesis